MKNRPILTNVWPNTCWKPNKNAADHLTHGLPKSGFTTFIGNIGNWYYPVRCALAMSPPDRHTLHHKSLPAPTNLISLLQPLKTYKITTVLPKRREPCYASFNWHAYKHHNTDAIISRKNKWNARPTRAKPTAKRIRFYDACWLWKNAMEPIPS